MTADRSVTIFYTFNGRESRATRWQSQVERTAAKLRSRGATNLRLRTSRNGKFEWKNL